MSDMQAAKEEIDGVGKNIKDQNYDGLENTLIENFISKLKNLNV